MFGLRFFAGYSTNLPAWFGPAWRQTRRVMEMGVVLLFSATMGSGGLGVCVSDFR